LLLWDEISWRARLTGVLLVLLWSWCFFKGLVVLAEKDYRQKNNEPAKPDETGGDSEEA
jgi:hypothetical protein